jgi:hypothetical protein
MARSSYMRTHTRPQRRPLRWLSGVPMGASSYATSVPPK